ncbi:hypothetical protein CEUSTIGMA_g584.t1 [Chlamydomonas eustigma]|uniref:Translocation protein SEC62 n=1 Tax=Chlamydomonas eustigma TaxID=1157962 RepID=A0A250WQQ6_9CHLO|nr:hypothetical protein CEUSTIGMA_g584.t1 [Chlamydomonas eustigma]|eukprot:GAX73131.1 hypothetical protein CEUSTIGMA_g584.t1 [Chlamydomonas eustigma]
MAKRKVGKEEDPYKVLADQLREKKGVDYANAKLELTNGDGEIIEFVRGKDLARFLRAVPEKMDGLVQPIRPGRTVEDQIRDLVHFFIHKGLMIKADRKYKKPKPGKKRLVKFPRTLLLSQDQSWDESFFYIWKYERPTTLLYYISAVALPIVVILACLFPLAPWWMRMAFVYTLMAILTAMLSLIAVRYVLFAFVWTLTGHSLWLFPNMMRDDVDVFQAFSPVITHEVPEKGKSQWKQRLLAGAMLGGTFYLLYYNAPDADFLKDEAMKAHESLLDYLDLAGKKKKFLDGGNQSEAYTTTSPPVVDPVNATS